MKKKIVSLCAFLLLTSCKPAGEKVVNAILGNILEPVSIEVTPGLDLGELLISEEATKVQVTIKNNSSEKITSINYNFDASLNLVNYVPDSKGVIGFPGDLGTCSTTLGPGKSCTIFLNILTRKQGDFRVPGKISYFNLIDNQEKDLTFTFTAGDPAALAFTNNKTSHSMGILEISDPTEKIETYEVKNLGGLTARNLDVSMSGDAGTGKAFNIVSSDCPKSLKLNQKCLVSVKYNSVNNSAIPDDDEEEMYAATLSFRFNKDPKGNIGYLNGYYSSTSTRIEAKFKSSLSEVDFGEIITGNIGSKTIKFSNRGFNKGTFKEILVKNPNNANKVFKCVLGNDSLNPKLLNCFQNNIPVVRSEFPYLIEDLSSCFSKEVNYLGGNFDGSPDCLIKISYHPSISYNVSNKNLADYNFNNAKLSINYDSFWKNIPDTLVTKNDVYKMLNTFKIKGHLEVERINFSSDVYGVGTGLDKPMGLDTVESNFYNVDFGRLALVNDVSIYDSVNIVLKNVGESQVDFISMKDHKNLLQVLANDLDKLDARDINAFYRGFDIDDTCATFISAGSTCTISFKLHLLKQPTSIGDIDQMFDIYTGTPDADSQTGRSKRFIYSYADSGQYKDDGSLLPERKVYIDLKALMVMKARLKLTASDSNMGTIVTGNTKDLTLNVKNIGTGPAIDISYLNTIATNNFFTNSELKFIKKSDNCTVAPANDLASNSTCQIVVKFENLDELKNDLSDPKDYKAYNQNIFNVVSGAFTLDLNYGDGDCNSAIPATCLTSNGDAIGKVLNIVNPAISYAFSDPAQLAFKQVTNFPTSILYNPKNIIDSTKASLDYTRPPRLYTSRNYPTTIMGNPLLADVSGKTVICTTLAASTVDDFNKKYIYRDGELCQNFKNNFQTNDTFSALDYHIIHLGRFDKTNTWSGSLVFASAGADKFSNLNMVEVNGVDKGINPADFVSLKKHIKITALNSQAVSETVGVPFSITNLNNTEISLNLNVNFANDVPTGAANFSIRCFKITYKSESLSGEDTDARWLNFCISAEFANQTPKFEITALEHETNWNSGTSQFDYTPGAQETVTLTKANFIDAAPLLRLESVSGRIVTSNPNTANNDLKKITIKNISGYDITEYRILLAKFSGSTVGDPVLASELTTQGVQITGNTCGTTLLNGAQCDFNLKFAPDSYYVKTDWTLMISTIDNNNHFQHFLKLSLTGASANKAIWVGNNLESSTIKDFSGAPAALRAANFYKITLNAFSPMGASHYLVGRNSNNIHTLSISNASTNLISFLKQTPSPIFNTGWATIKTQGAFKVEANTGCFYGDIGSGNPTIAGFGSATSLPNRCSLRITYNPEIKYISSACANTGTTNLSGAAKNIGGRLDSTCSDNFISLDYWSYKRKTFDTIHFYFDGDIEPPRLTLSSVYTPVINTKLTELNASSKAEVNLPLPLLTNTETSLFSEFNPADIDGFTVLYTKSALLTALKNVNIFNPSTYTSAGITAINIPASATNVTITNLDRNTAYFFKILIRVKKPASKPTWPAYYYSDFTGSQVHSMVTPVDQNFFYLSQYSSFVDRRLRNTTPTSFTAAKTSCANSYLSSSNFSAPSQRMNSRLINHQEFESIRSGIVPSVLQSNLAGYSVGNQPHWVNETVVNVSTATLRKFNGEAVAGGFPDFNPNKTSDYKPSLGLGYLKTCTNNTCQNLALIMGYFEELSSISYYVPDSSTLPIAYPRCATNVKCPFNFGIGINDVNCK